MSILEGIKDKAKELLNISEPYAVKQTRNYDSSKNSIIVAGVKLDGVVSSNLSGDTLTKQEQGIDYSYTTYYQSLEPRTLVVTILPTALCLDMLRNLALVQQKNNGWFNIAIHENDVIVNVYRGFILDLPSLSSEKDADDRQVTFGVKTMFAGVSSINQASETEQMNYSKYGINPAEARAETTTIIDEVTGVKQEESYFDDQGVTDDYDSNFNIDDILPPENQEPIVPSVPDDGT